MSTSLTQTPLRQVKDIRGLLQNDMARQQLAMVAARHISPERMMRVVANSVRTTPKLAECEPLSFLGALMTCSSLGLEPNTVMGHAYLVPFKNNKKGLTEVQVVIGYKGLMDLARRYGNISSIDADIHYSDDDLWDCEQGTEARLRHRKGPEEGEKQHAYAVAKFKDGGHAFVVLPWSRVLKIRDESQNYKTAIRYGNTGSSVWTTHEDEMAKKTAIRALMKYLPLSAEFADAMEIDNRNVDYRAFALNPEASLEILNDNSETENKNSSLALNENKKNTSEQNRATQEDKTESKKDKSPKEILIEGDIINSNNMSDLDAAIEIHQSDFDEMEESAQNRIQSLIDSKTAEFRT